MRGIVSTAAPTRQIIYGADYSRGFWLAAAQNVLIAAFDLRRKPLPRPKLPQAPGNTVAFDDSIYSPNPGATLTVFTTVGVGVNPDTMPDVGHSHEGAAGPRLML